MDRFYEALTQTWEELQAHPLVAEKNTSEEHLTSFLALFNNMINTPFEKNASSIFRWLRFQTNDGLKETGLYEDYPALILLSGTRDITDALDLSELLSLNYSNTTRSYILTINGVKYVHANSEPPRKELSNYRREPNRNNRAETNRPNKEAAAPRENKYEFYKQVRQQRPAYNATGKLAETSPNPPVAILKKKELMKNLIDTWTDIQDPVEV